MGKTEKINGEDALRRFLSWRWRDICFSFLRLSHWLVLWHYVFRRSHCSCLHGEAADVDLCIVYLFRIMHFPFPVHITNMFFLFCCTFSTQLRQSSRCTQPIRRRMLLDDLTLHPLTETNQPGFFAILFNCNVKGRPVYEGTCHECCYYPEAKSL